MKVLLSNNRILVFNLCVHIAKSVKLLSGHSSIPENNGEKTKKRDKKRREEGQKGSEAGKKRGSSLHGDILQPTASVWSGRHNSVRATLRELLRLRGAA